jgi:hypothetical protein
MSLPAFTESKEGPQVFFEIFYVLACVYRVQRETSTFILHFPHDITYQEKKHKYYREKDTMLRFKKMDCLQECKLSQTLIFTIYKLRCWFTWGIP